MCSHRSNCIVPPLRTCAAIGVSALYHCCLHMQPWEYLHCSTHEYMCNHRNKHIIQSLNTCAAIELKHALQHRWIHNYNFITHYITAALEIQSVFDRWEDFHFFPILCTLLGQNMKNTRLKKKILPNIKTIQSVWSIYWVNTIIIPQSIIVGIFSFICMKPQQ